MQALDLAGLCKEGREGEKNGMLYYREGQKNEVKEWKKG